MEKEVRVSIFGTSLLLSLNLTTHSCSGSLSLSLAISGYSTLSLVPPFIKQKSKVRYIWHTMDRSPICRTRQGGCISETVIEYRGDNSLILRRKWLRNSHVEMYVCPLRFEVPIQAEPTSWLIFLHGDWLCWPSIASLYRSVSEDCSWHIGWWVTLLVQTACLPIWGWALTELLLTMSCTCSHWTLMSLWGLLW